jgi:polyferredoxin
MTAQQTRKNLQWTMAPLVPLVIIGGSIWPSLGYISITLMVIMLVMAFFRGRYYCGWICPMGAFHERLLSKVSLHKKMLPAFKKTWFKWTIFLIMMSLLTTRLLLTNGDSRSVGAVFVMMWTLSTTLAIGIGIIWKPRSWCSFCPMALSQSFLSPRTYRLQVADSCKQCGLCQKVCPIETYAGAHKDEVYVKSSDCMRCGKCIEKCPGKKISFSGKR